MVPIFVEAAARAALLATGTVMVLRAFRITSAAVTHAAWTAVVLMMLALPMWLAAGLRLSLPILRAASGASVAATTNSASLGAEAGLKLDADKAPVDHLVIDHMERPTPDGPVPVSNARAFGGGR